MSKASWDHQVGHDRNGAGETTPLADEQAATESDQSASESDQTVADADQTTADADQASADADQVASDRDQEAADRELSGLPTDISEMMHAHEQSRVARESSTLIRHATTFERAKSAQERAQEASERDETARLRDLASQARDNAAAHRDALSEQLERELGSNGATRGATRAAIDQMVEVRSRAAADRKRAAADRERAAADRKLAAIDRRNALIELRQAHTDDLTGAYRRGIGEVALQHEIDRARRVGERLVLAFVDVDGLKAINDDEGHQAGDLRLRNVVAAVRSILRSYEPVVRYGGDEFLCSIAGIDLEEARARFDRVGEILAGNEEGSSVSVGLAALRSTDTLHELIARADAALAAAR